MSNTLKIAQNRLSAVAQTLTRDLGGTEYNFPAFDDLPKVEGMPQGNIWGFFDKDSKRDEIGSMYPPLSLSPHIYIYLQRSLFFLV